MESLERNRVFAATEIGNLKTDVHNLLDKAIEISENFNKDRDKTLELLAQVPSEAKYTGGNLSIQLLPPDFIYSDYADNQKKQTIYYQKSLPMYQKKMKKQPVQMIP